MAPVGLTVALVAATDSPPLLPPSSEVTPLPTVPPGTPTTPDALGLWWTRLSLTGQVVQPPTQLQPREPAPLVGPTDYLVMASVFVLALLMIYLFWRRDAQWQRLDLPESLVLADLPRRALAGAIDLLPPVVIVMLAYGLSPEDLIARWPRSNGASTWQAIAPGLLVIGLFVLYCTLAELIAARTAGKALLGLRVATLDGQRPRAWQLAVRNLLKVFDLIAWLLLLLPVIGPYRQRLGDLVARTVVVMPAPPEEEEEDEE